MTSQGDYYSFGLICWRFDILKKIPVLVKVEIMKNNAYEEPSQDTR